MTRLSASANTIKPAYEVVVIGSGYGGSIAASRMSRAGKSVCLLERGKEFRPGEYPDNVRKAMAEMQIDLPGRHKGPADGLFDFRVNKDMNVLQGCGLGGTSLINANVSLVPEAWVFADERWPKDLQNDTELLEECFHHARRMLKPETYPSTWPTPAKMDNMRVSADGMGESIRFYRTPINVNFAEKVNHVGVHQPACTGCGDCVSGCNVGAKNTTLMNYLPDAKNHGAEIFTQTAVRRIEQVKGQWHVHYQLVGQGREKFSDKCLVVRGAVVVMAAGTMGTTEILLRSANHGLVLSNRLGHCFTGNGDFLAFGYNTDRRVNAVGTGAKAPDPADPVGPCITAILDFRGQTAPEDGMVIEEGVAPGALGKFLPHALAFAGKKFFPRGRTFPELIRRKIREVQSLVWGAYRGAMNNTMTYLVMTHDDTAGTMRLHNDRLRLDWPGVGKLPIFQKVKGRLQEAIKQLGGDFVPSPTWNKLMGHDLVTVHPLGGCIMAETAEKGVVNHKGQVYSGTTGTGVYEGLYICDGSIIPRSVGVNPLMTISGLSERNCHYMAKDRGWTYDYAFDAENREEETEIKAASPGIRFTERMAGYLAFTEEETSFKEAYEAGKARHQDFDFVLTITAENLEAMLTDPKHQAWMTGVVNAPLLSPAPITVSEGVFNLFDNDPGETKTKYMRYRMNLTTREGNVFHFSGYKHIHDDAGFDLWQDTTTLFVTIYNGPDDQAPVLGKGMLKILPQDFMKQLTTLQVLHTDQPGEILKVKARFGTFFAGSLVEVFGGPMANLIPPTKAAAPPLPVQDAPLA